MIDIDGSLHSGSGTIVRHVAAYAALAGQPNRVRNARARRRGPGLRPQHLRAIQAMRDLVGGSLDGAGVGSRSFEFRPGNAEPTGRYAWDIGTAGSATMVALSVLPVLAFRGRGAEAEIRGGLFQDFAPSEFHLQHVIVPMLAQMGLAVPPAARPLRPLTARRGQAPARVWGIALASHLDDRHVAARMAAAARTILDTAGIGAHIKERSDTTAAQAGAAFALFADGTSTFQVPFVPSTPRPPGGWRHCSSAPRATHWWCTAKTPGTSAWTHTGKTTRRHGHSAACARHASRYGRGQQPGSGDVIRVQSNSAHGYQHMLRTTGPVSTLAYPAPQARSTTRRRPEGDHGPWRHGLDTRTLLMRRLPWCREQAPARTAG